tara:strand:+ start:648 stop:785 length:138 start_codon:yes stop_codon:yes gene_type:complete
MQESSEGGSKRSIATDPKDLPEDEEELTVGDLPVVIFINLLDHGL